LPAACLHLTEGLRLTALPRDRTGWGSLCRVLSIGRLRARKGECILHLDDLLAHAKGLELLLHAPEGAAPEWRRAAERLSRLLGPQTSLLMAPRYDGQDKARFRAAEALSDALGLATVASARPLMHHGSRRRLTDILTCIREGLRVEELGTAAQANAEQRLRSEAEIRRIFTDHADAVDRTVEVAARAQFDIRSLRYEYPSEIAEGESAAERLTRLARAGLQWRYPQGIPERAQKQLDHELRLIAKLGYEPYFLTVHDIVAFARSRGILCQGRGSAANSITCYALGVTSVSPEIGTMVFERFVSEARNEPPDIDVDFEHERREEVIQHIYERYGRHRAGLCATVIHYRGKRAVREVGKAMGLSEDVLSALSSQIWGSWSKHGPELERMREIGLDPDSPRLRQTIRLIEEIIGFPRHLSQHVGGFVITEGRLDELVPIENATMEDRTVISWDKDDIDALGILKVDILALGMLTCIRKAFTLLKTHHQADYTLATLPPEDPAVYEMLCRADSLGVFQVESRAQMNFLPRMRPRCFYDLVIQVAIIRPGAHPGRHGPPLHPPPQRGRGGELPLRRAWPRARQDAGRAALPGTGDADRHRRRGLHARRRPTACAARSPPSRSTATCPSSAPASCGACARTATTTISPSAASPRSKASAPTASRRATRRPSRCWSTPPPGSSGTIPASSPARFLTRSPWASMRRLRSSATPANTGWRCGPSA
jgi:DNA polymerase III alpha subunit